MLLLNAVSTTNKIIFTSIVLGWGQRFQGQISQKLSSWLDRTLGKIWRIFYKLGELTSFKGNLVSEIVYE